MKVNLALLEGGPSSPQNPKTFQLKNKDLVAEIFDWDEEEVFDEEEFTQVKVLMALADDDLTVGKNHARNGKWVDITMRKVNTLLSMDEDADWQNYLKRILILESQAVNESLETLNTPESSKDSEAQRACFFAKASESINWLWDKRLSHLNFKNINKLAKQDKVLGLPSLVYSKDKPFTKCEKEKHHRASFKTKQNFPIKKCLHLLHMDLFGPNDQMITQPTNAPLGNNIEGPRPTTEPLVLDVTQSYILNQASTSSHPAPQDRWSRDQHIELVNIIGNLGEIMLTRGMAAKLKAASAIARMEAIRIFLTFATYMNFKVYQMDVKSAFLNGKLKEEIYVKQMPGFESSEFPDYVCKLNKALYGLKQAPRACSSVKTPMVPPNNLGHDLAGKPVNENLYKGMKGILKPLKDTLTLGLYYPKCLGFDPKGYSDSNYVGYYMDKKSTLGEAEYFAAAGCCASILWIKSQLSDYDIHYKMVPIFCNNTSTTVISNNLEELLQFKMQKVWVLVDLPNGKRAIGFEDPDYLDKVYKVVKALYELHQALRAWYETLANYLLENGFQRGKNDQTLFIKQQKGDILLVQSRFLVISRIYKVFGIVFLKKRRVVHVSNNVYRRSIELVIGCEGCCCCGGDDGWAIDDGGGVGATCNVEGSSCGGGGVGKKEDNDVLRYQALKRKPQTKAHARKNTMVYLKNMVGFKMDFFRGMSYEDIRPIFKKYFNSNVAFLEKSKEQLEGEESRALKRKTKSSEEKVVKKQKLDEEATPLALKVPAIDYEIHSENNKPYYKIIRANGSHQLFLSFLSLLRDFNREDLEVLWQVVKERFASSKPKNFSDDFLLTTIKAMFEKPDVEAQVWKNQKGIHDDLAGREKISIDKTYNCWCKLMLLDNATDSRLRLLEESVVV
nr:retrovirus-related Pol polyprotein from transposon TNT 1-94 [Tanacetum cinerariifolium]